jgi:DNA-binding NarL/FixJ family response regulator
MNPAKALIVDDNSMLRETTRTFLESRFPGLCVLEAQDGIEAFQQTNNHEPDLILMDIGLPGENGLRLTRKIKSLYPQIAIAIFSDYDLAEYRKAAFEYGADFFLSKSSFHKNGLSRVVEFILAGAE